VALNLYLDDCANSNLLARLLREAGHSVVRPDEAGISGADDEVHLDYAIQHGLILITKDPDDFQLLHDQNPNHHGIFGIYQDNIYGKDMTDADIVAAIGRIEAAVPLGYPLGGVFHVLNDWR
jgi:predicted nuclease of predicted toxin-antitoxin system